MKEEKKLKVLLITNLFPNNKEPNRGIFIKQEALELAKLCDLKVVAPIAWLPSFMRLFLPNSINYEILKKEYISGIEIYHPKWFVTPKIFRCLYGVFFFFSIFPIVKKIMKNFDFDVIYSPWVYPDGFACVLLGKLLKKPVILHALGCDINRYTKTLLRRILIKWALKKSDIIISVSEAIKKRINDLGINEEKVYVVPNGVDFDLFRPLNKKDCREEIGFPLMELIFLFIGTLEKVKGIDYLIEAFAEAIRRGRDKIRLVIVGTGPCEPEIRAKIEKYGIQNVVTLAGEVKHEKIPVWMNAADVFCLPSIREGMPNVILEALSCRKYVLATKVGGVPEIILSEKQGILVPPKDSAALRLAIENIIAKSNNSLQSENDNLISWETNAKIIIDKMNNLSTGCRNKVVRE